jgi:DNA-binding NarL/FixJ family response regulator
MTAKILIADDHGIVRQGIRSLLERQGDIEVVAEAVDGVEALLLVRKFKPDVVIVDAGMPNFNGMEATRRMLKEFPGTKIVTLSGRSCEGFVKAMFEAGICGYILKDGLFGELIGAIRTVLEGGIYLSPGITGIEVDDYVKHLAEDSKI